MFKWIKSLFHKEEVEITDHIEIVTTHSDAISTGPEKDLVEIITTTQDSIRKKMDAKPAPKKKAKSVDLDSMNKTQLLEHAKKNKIKANASMKKADILAAIKNG